MGLRGLQTGDLNEKQKCFAFEYVVDFHATNAAIRAGYSERSASAQASELLNKPAIQELIEEYKERAARLRRINRDWVLDQWAQIASANPADLVSVQVVRCRSCWPDLPAGELPPNPECKKCHGAGERMEVCVTDTRKLTGAAKLLYAGAKQTKDGIEIKMRDQDGALAKIANYFGMERNDQRIQAVVENLTRPVKTMTDDELMALASAGPLQLEGGTPGGTPSID